jgi:dTDP-4-amino-4,6-dideoxygalactose transaminase
VHGGLATYHHEQVGGNFRMDAIQAAVLSVKLPRLDGWNARRRAIAARYASLLGAEERIGLPVEGGGREHTYHQYVVRVRDRDAVRRRLTERRVATSVFYPVPLHLQECFAAFGGRKGDFPESERAAREVLALPMFAELTDSEVERVAEAVLESLGPT